jgi:hypothetical protein
MSENNEKLVELLLDEVRLNRKEIKELRAEIWALKTRFALIAMTLGVAGGKVAQFIPFLK